MTNGVYGDITYSYRSEGQSHTNTNDFVVDNGSTFTVRFESSGNLITFLTSVELWNSVESP
jgi:hypothetical protein